MVINIWKTTFAVLRYAKKCGIRTTPASFSNLTIRNSESPERPFFTAEQVTQIVRVAKEPTKPCLLYFVAKVNPGVSKK